MCSKKVSTEEWWVNLQKDETYKKLTAEKEAARKKACEKAAREEVELVKDLNGVDCKVSSVWDLVNTADKYPNAIPVLMKHIDYNYSNDLKEGIIRALTVRWLSNAKIVEKLLDCFRLEKDDNLRWVIGNALSVISKTKEHADMVLSFIENTNYGQSRSELVTAYARIYKQDAIPKLIDFLQDKELCVIAINALGKLKAVEARSQIEHYTSHEDSWVRQHAKKALKKIDKVLG